MNLTCHSVSPQCLEYISSIYYKIDQDATDDLVTPELEETSQYYCWKITTWTSSGQDKAVRRGTCLID